MENDLKKYMNQFLDWIFETKLGYLLFMFFFITLFVIIINFIFGGSIIISLIVGYGYSLIMVLTKKELRMY